MARLPRGGDLLEKAQGMLAEAKDANELRRLQAVALPLAHGMSIEETAAAIGRSPRWATDARGKFIRAKGEPGEPRPKMRSRAYLTEAEEAAFLEPFIESARHGEVLVAGEIHRVLEARLGRKVAKATAYNLLHRHGWRKLAPDKRHVSADPEAQEEWKKNARKNQADQGRVEKGRRDEADVPGRGPLRTHIGPQAVLVPEAAQADVQEDDKPRVHVRLRGGQHK